MCRMCSLPHFQVGWHGDFAVELCGAQQSYLFFLSIPRFFVHTLQPLHHWALRHGWVPLDPADVRKTMLVEKLDIKDPKTKEYQDYFWGGIDPYRVAIAKGRDLILNPRQAEPELISLNGRIILLQV
jgi:hypothetical protein